MEKLDLTKQFKGYYKALKQPALAEFAAGIFLAAAGRGEPGGAAYLAQLQALYAVAYAVKFAARAIGQDYTVPKLEGLWWVDGPAHMLDTPREEWQWKLLLRVPDYIGGEQVSAAAEQVARAKKMPLASAVRLAQFAEGPVVNVLHVGPYATERTTNKIMAAFMAAQGLEPAGLHHEIYLTDPRKTAPENGLTILRQPVRPVTSQPPGPHI